eukprot:Hpha_TRINITY_DN11536_c0_g1::TRINITY_DN11536_c0_g1_i1::g.32257::m.32257
MKFTFKDCDLSELDKGDREYLISRRTEIDGRYCEVIDDLLLVAQVAEADLYGDEPLRAMDRLRTEPVQVVHIPAELKNICDEVQQTKLRNMWQKEGKPGVPEGGASFEEETAAREKWVSERVEEGIGAVEIELPEDRLGAPQGAVSRLLQERQMSNKQWAAVAARRSRDLAAEREKHPAEAVQLSAAARKPLRHDPTKFGHGGAQSSLAALFSKSTAAAKPDFLATPSGPSNRRQQVEDRRRNWEGRNVGRRSTGTPVRSKSANLPGRASTSAINVNSRFRPEASGPREILIPKDVGAPFSVAYEPSTLRLAEERGEGLRGMRIHAVGVGEEAKVEVSDAADLRKLFASALHVDCVKLYLEPWRARWAVEKRRSEWRAKLPGQK